MDKEYEKKKTIRSQIAFSIISLFVLLCVLLVLTLASEAFVRWYFSDILSTATGNTFFSNRSRSKFTEEQNTFGLRGKPFNVVKSAGVVRVVVLGDSFAYGQGVWPYGKRFPEQAMEIVQKQYPNLNIEIINTGIAGQDLIQHNKYLESFVLALKPDFVLYQWYVNDMNTTYDDLAVFIAPPLVSCAKWHKKLMEESVLYYLVQRAWGQIRAILGLQKNVTNYFADKFGDSKSKHSIAAQQQLNKLLNRLEQESIPHGIVLFPSLDTKMNEYQLGSLHEQVLDVCKEHATACLDLRDVYSKHDGQLKKLWANIFDHHPSSLAHRLAAEEIVDFYGDTWVNISTLKSSRTQ